MEGPTANTSTKSFKRAFLRNLLLSLHARTSASASMSLHERRHAVKSSADVAMAAARAASCTGARWPKAILEATPAPASGTCKVRRCRRIVRRCRGRKRSSVARRLLRRRTMALREVVPGGRDAAVDEDTLLREAMDYVVHLRAQVDVLRRVSEAVQTAKHPARFPIYQDFVSFF